MSSLRSAMAGKIMTSPTGEFWTAMHVDDIASDLRGVAYGNNTFVAIGDSVQDPDLADAVDWMTRRQADDDLLPRC